MPNKEPDWLRLTDALVAGQPALLNVARKGALGRMRALKPEVRLEPTEWGSALVWSAGQEAESGPLDGLLGAFLALAGAEDDSAYLEFARRFGPLGAGAPVRQGPRAESQGVGAEGLDGEGQRGWAVAEPVAVWRMLARGLGALLDLYAGQDGGQVLPPATRRQLLLRGIGAVAALAWLNHPDPAHVPEDQAFARLFLEKVLLDYTLQDAETERQLRDRFERAVRALSGAGEPAAAGQRRFAWDMAAVGAVPRQDDRGEAEWLVRDLRPVLGIQFALAARKRQSTMIMKCSGCGGEITVRPGTRKPRRDQPYYGPPGGPHDKCREEARRKSKRESAREAYRKKKSARGEEDALPIAGHGAATGAAAGA